MLSSQSAQLLILRAQATLARERLYLPFFRFLFPTTQQVLADFKLTRQLRDTPTFLYN